MLGLDLPVLLMGVDPGYVATTAFLPADYGDLSATGHESPIVETTQADSAGPWQKHAEAADQTTINTNLNVALPSTPDPGIPEKSSLAHDASVEAQHDHCHMRCLCHVAQHEQATLPDSQALEPVVKMKGLAWPRNCGLTLTGDFWESLKHSFLVLKQASVAPAVQHPSSHEAFFPTAFIGDSPSSGMMRAMGMPTDEEVTGMQEDALRDAGGPTAGMGWGAPLAENARISHEEVMRITKEVAAATKVQAQHMAGMVHDGLGLSDCSCPQGHNYDAPCPKGWSAQEDTDTGLPICMPPDGYSGFCNKPQLFDIADEREKIEAENSCDVCWPCVGDQPAPASEAQERFEPCEDGKECLSES